MPRTPRRRLAKGVYVDKYSLTGVVSVGGKSIERAFERGTPIKDIQRWREEERVRRRYAAPKTPARGTLAADVPIYLERMRKRPASLGQRASELKPWIARFGTLARDAITPRMIDETMAAWLAEGIAPKTVRNRCATLRHLYVTMADDRRARTPFDNIDRPTVQKRRPAYVAPETIRAVAERLTGKDRARFMVLAATGIRPSQMKRLTPADVDLVRRLVLIPGGKGGLPIVHALNSDMVAAWRAFARANAWGPYHASGFAKRCRRAGWPPGVRVYNAKHSLGIELAEKGAEMADIQAWFGHTSDATTKIYTGVPIARMRRIAEQLDGRLGWGTTPRNAPRVDAGSVRSRADSGGNRHGAKTPVKRPDQRRSA